MLPPHIGKYISETYIFGIIQLDLTLHFIIGAILSILILKKLKLSHAVTFFIILLIALVKEASDSFRLNATLLEAAEDTVATIFYPLLTLIIKKIRKS